MAQMIKPAPAKPEDNNLFAEKILWLIHTYGFDMRANKVVMLYEPSKYCSMSLEAFKTEYMHWFETEQQKSEENEKIEKISKPKSRKPKTTFATTVWMLNPKRESIAGVRMRPDQDFPTYRENGETFKNTYRQPQHVDDGTGEIKTFTDFMERFLPDATEGNWMLDWMAHKWLHPEIPGTTPVLVANDTFGVGRGLFGRICAKLYGEAYCKFEDFDIITGTSAQAVYTDWQADCIMTMVDEAHVSPTAYRRGEKRGIYTSLKTNNDPAAKRRSFKVKGGAAYDGVSYNSMMIFTNHINAMAIPANDRRFSVLRNGRPMTPEEAKTLNTWIEKPANIAALARELEASDLTKFDMYTPLKTEAKDEMADLALDEVENALIDFAADDDRGLVFPRLFLEREMEAQINGDGERVGSRDNTWRGHLAGAFDQYCMRVKLPKGARARIWISKRRYSLFCFRSRTAAAHALDETKRRIEAAKWGAIDDIQTVLREVKRDAE